jgi:phosphate starvation-inducible PhoH-like protein
MAKRYTGKDNVAGETYTREVKPKNGVQEHFMSMIKESTITFGLGPAGTGKTYVAIAMALKALLNKEVDKLILTRPIVATEEIGFLPGTMDEKIHPYIMPLFDALEAQLGPVKARELLALGKIEVIPLAFMRGRSLDRAIIILDEAQNSTPEQIKMFLTRLGYNSKMIITGDEAQSDLKGPNGLVFAANRLLTGSDPEITGVRFTKKNIVRNPLIEVILDRLDSPAVDIVEPVGKLPKVSPRFYEAA